MYYENGRLQYVLPRYLQDRSSCREWQGFVKNALVYTFSVALLSRPVPSRPAVGLEYCCLLCPVSFCSVLGGLGSFDSLTDSLQDSCRSLEG